MITAKVLEDVYSDDRPEGIHMFDADYLRDTGTMFYTTKSKCEGNSVINIVRTIINRPGYTKPGIPEYTVLFIRLSQTPPKTDVSGRWQNDCVARRESISACKDRLLPGDHDE